MRNVTYTTHKLQLSGPTVISYTVAGIFLECCLGNEINAPELRFSGSKTIQNGNEIEILAK